ncbi:aminotransferase class I/II-fold pyridoxal phosphate-dependent enzyme [Dongia sp.]|uniref:aminotransferase class I/II-fold pyridoxal phosphate-dependent enzyme n=1 Tax=Dongia sp. TaxID=1977262 RepID=UPI0037524673
MPESPRNFGLLSTQEKQELLKQAFKRRGGESLAAQNLASPNGAAQADREPDDSTWQVEKFPAYQQLLVHRAAASHMGVDNPFFTLHEGRVGATTTVDGREILNFSNYNYLGLNDDPRVIAAAKSALDRYGVSAAASRVVSGERPIHRELEQALAALHGAEDAVAFVSGVSTNVTTIGSLMGSRDLILHDRLIHNSAVQGALLSGATRIPYPHNDMAALRQILDARRTHHEKVLIVAEGVYSMDGDICPLDQLVEIKRRYRALLLVDEAHSIGVLGARGRGIGEHFGIAGADVDLWMGTLSKTLSGCGGYIAGGKAMVELLKFTAPGFVYSVGMAPALAAASRAALDCMLAEPGRIEALRANGKLFLELATQHGLDVGLSQGLNIVPVITGKSVTAARLANALFKRGINANPIIYPAVEERAARLRFFISSMHSADQIREAVSVTAEESRRLSAA